MKFNHKFALLLAAAPFTALAAGPVAPDAGSLLQQMRPAAPPSPSSPGTGLSIEKEGGVKLPPSTPFLVNKIRITGNTLFDTTTLHALVADMEGKAITLSQLDELASRITDYYHNHGYPLARAIIPAQTIHDGVVEIQVIEARYGKIKLDNKSRVEDPLLLDTLSTLKSGDNVAQVPLEHALLLLSDIPGVATSAMLQPGEAAGTSDLLVDVQPGPSVSGNAALDNFGNRYTGRMRLGGTVNFIDPLNHGDYLSLGGLSSGSGINYGRIAYDMILNGAGTHLGASVSSLHYLLGDAFASLNGHGIARVVSVWAKHPFLRSRDFNLYGQIQYDAKHLEDHVDSTGTRTDRHLGNWTGSFTGDIREDRAAVDTGSFSVTAGRLDFDDSFAQFLDSFTAKTQGVFTKWNASFSRTQSLSAVDTLYFSATGQWADGNLDSSEKMSVGGPYTVRAYDMGAVSGDSGYLGTLELRRRLGDEWTMLAFYDSAHVRVNTLVWSAGVNDATLSGAGLGLNFSGFSRWNARAYVAARIGQAPPLVASTSFTRAWVEASRNF